VILAAGVGLYAPLAAGVRRLAEWVRDEAAAAPQEGDGRGHRTILHGPQVRASFVLPYIRIMLTPTLEHASLIGAKEATLKLLIIVKASLYLLLHRRRWRNWRTWPGTR
jgi:hypothetical protein